MYISEKEMLKFIKWPEQNNSAICPSWQYRKKNKWDKNTIDEQIAICVMQLLYHLVSCMIFITQRFFLRTIMCVRTINDSETTLLQQATFRGGNKRCP